MGSWADVRLRAIATGLKVVYQEVPEGEREYKHRSGEC